MTIRAGRNPEPHASALGRFVRDLRTEAGMSQQQLAAAVGASRPWISSVERGWPVSRDLLLKILQTLNVPDPEAAVSKLHAHAHVVAARKAVDGIFGRSTPPENANPNSGDQLRRLASSLKGLLREYQDADRVVGVSPELLAAIKATIFDLEDLAEGSAPDPSRSLSARRRWRYFTGALIMVRQAANAAKRGFEVTGDDAPRFAKQDSANGDHQTE